MKTSPLIANSRQNRALAGCRARGALVCRQVCGSVRSFTAHSLFVLVRGCPCGVPPIVRAFLHVIPLPIWVPDPMVPAHALSKTGTEATTDGRRRRDGGERTPIPALADILHSRPVLDRLAHLERRFAEFTEAAR
ncbi:hypothetical protein Msi02_04870 [Microbispora siamensis]|uniref:Uncharacterized protein n=1 Tax=Microbispora siamensis TaxID=564413 RepID=A0ABQ4GE12_9ACTN|nr:hypothetical protein Msi02_04870 [Microbispora siamensis]